MKYLKVVWHVLLGLVYLGVVIGVLSISTTRFETLVLAGLVQLYAAVLYNFSLLGVATDVNNYAGFVRFRILASAHGIAENEDGPFEMQEKALADGMRNNKTQILVRQFSHFAVAIYALFKIVQAILLT